VRAKSFGGMAQAVEHLPRKQKDLSSNSSSKKKKDIKILFCFQEAILHKAKFPSS
jgi:hypothetical protein